MADLSRRMSDVRQRESKLEKVRRPAFVFQPYQTVSNNLGVYFLFCLFGSAILALFLWSSMRFLQTSLSFFVLRRQVWQVFMYQ